MNHVIYHMNYVERRYFKMAMTNQEKLDKAQDRVECLLDEKHRKLSELTLQKIGLVDSIDRMEYRLTNLAFGGGTDRREDLISKKNEAERCLDALIDEISVLALIINAITIGIEMIKEGEVGFEIDYNVSNSSNDTEEYSNKVSSTNKR